MHNRKKIREYIGSLLTNKTEIGDRVKFNRTKRITVPSIEITSMSEENEIDTEAPRTLKRRLKLNIEAIIAVNTDSESLYDRLDNISKKIEQEMIRDRSLDGLVNDLYLESSDLAPIHQEGDAQIGSCLQIYTVEYFTDDYVEDDFDQFESVQAKLFIDDNNVIKDEFEIIIER